MNQLQSLIIQEIQEKGPMTVKRFMELALYHPLYGYYKSQTALGKQADYITAPELSQAFGELLALWMIDLWQRLGKPSVVQVIELGPGRGTMMQDILRMARKFPEFYKGIAVYLLETSPILKGIQKDHLQNEPIFWVDELQEIPKGRVTFFLANEFFDALPIEQHVKVQGEWNHRLISEKDGELYFSAGGEIKETCESYASHIIEINKRLIADKGGALIIDYGDDFEGERIGDTLQALHHHRYADVLKNPGEQDLTHHVNFLALKDYLDKKNLKISLTSQGQFLQSLGLELWVEKLCEKADIEMIMKIKTAAARLIAPGEMGQLFKVLEVESH
ncbi:MAG: SAM-dependent methyltransferase [Alphaproteobacteria bacterium]|nr:SAM-dependent methyltransferase [Alphaproteobacteria bacterium]